MNFTAYCFDPVQSKKIKILVCNVDTPVEAVAAVKEQIPKLKRVQVSCTPKPDKPETPPEPERA